MRGHLSLVEHEQAKYKIQLDPTVEEVKKLCTTCRIYAKSERVLFHYNGHGVPKPTANGEIWFFNRVMHIFCLGCLTTPSFKHFDRLILFVLVKYCRVIHSIFLCLSETLTRG